MKKLGYKLFLMSFLFAIIGVFSTSSVFAQSNPMVVEIPFNFHVGNEKLAAGKYQVLRIKDNSFLFRNVEGNAKALAQTPVTIDIPQQEVTAEKLVFNRYGDQYFLRQIFATRANLGRALYESKTEKMARHGLDTEMEAKSGQPEKVEVAVKK